MKKNILHLLLLTLIFIPYQGFGDDCEKQCTIRNSPDKALLDYISNTRIILGNIQAQVGEEGEINEASANLDLIRIYNYHLFNWGGYFNSFDYNVILPLTSEIPIEIRRDYDLIRDTLDYQHNFLYKLALQGSTKTTVSNICGDIKDCNLPESGSAGDLTAQVVANTKSLISIYRLSVTGNNTAAAKVETDFGEAFNSQITKHYNKPMLIACSQCEGATKHRINEALKNITTNNQSWKDGIDKWRDGIALIRGEKQLLSGERTQSEAEKQKERDNLRKELKRQGASQNTQDVILGNLQKHQEGGSFINNNVLTNSFREISDTIQTITNIKLIGRSKKAVEEKQNESTSNTSNDDTNINIKLFEDTTKDIDRTQEIDNIVGSLQKSLQTFNSAHDNSSNITKARVQKMHESLTNILSKYISEKTIKNAEKACNRQNRGEGKCSNY